jgi:glutamate racemase
LPATRSTPRVLVFDSGVGSLSVGAEIHALLPGVELLYVMDRGGFPYGQWQEQPLAEHIEQRIQNLFQHHDADLLVMACNSASTIVLPVLRERLHLPIVGVVPAIKPAAALSQTKVIGLLATPGTVKRAYTANLIREFAADCSVIQLGSSELAPAIETLFWEGIDSPEVWERTATQLLAQPRAQEMDTVVLACTHFPLIRDRLAVLIPNINWVDSGAAIARRVAHILNELGKTPSSEQTGGQHALVLGESPSDHFCQALKARGIDLLDP